MLVNTIKNLLEEKYKEEDYEDCFTVDVSLSQSNKLEVFIDADSGITFKKCQRISRYLEAEIDEHKWLGEKYTIEVSSPGIRRPLKFKRQYHKNIGRKVEVKLLDGGKATGTLTVVNEQGIEIEDKVRIKEGKKKKTVLQQTQIAFENIKETKVKISF